MVKFCGVCGSQLNESGVCPKCGSAEQDPLTNEEPANVVYPRHKTVAADIGDTAAEKKNEDKDLQGSLHLLQQEEPHKERQLQHPQPPF